MISELPGGVAFSDAFGSCAEGMWENLVEFGLVPVDREMEGSA
jgi:hypothetical protein